MNHLEHLLTCLGEEGGEIAQQCSKSLRFGLSDRNVLNPTGPTNKERLIVELNDLLAVADMLADRGILPRDWPSKDLQIAKKARVKKFMDYSRKQGCLR
jgi:hypothetical protein